MAIEIGRLPGFIKGHFVVTAVFGVPFLACVAVGIIFENQKWIFGPAFATGAVLAIVGFLLQVRRFRHANCPTCGERMPRFEIGDGKPVRFRCARCDVVWDTGMRDSDSIEG